MPCRRYLAFASLLSAAVSAPAVPPPSGQAKTRWVLREIDGRPVGTAPYEAALLVFGADHQIGGSGGCNSFAGKAIRWSGDRRRTRGTFRFDPRVGMPWTVVQCAPSPSERDGALFWQKMRRPASWRASARRLTIVFADGSTARLIPEPPR